MPARASKDSAAPPVAIVVSRYNGSVTAALEEGARRAYADRGGNAASLLVVEAPGAFELTALSMAAARGGRVGGVVALGCIIKGETSHDAIIAHAVAQGLTNVTIATGVPVAFGVLTVDTPAQARDRAGGAHGNKGHEAMTALLDTIAAAAAIRTTNRTSSRTTSRTTARMGVSTPNRTTARAPARARASSRPDKARRITN